VDVTGWDERYAQRQWSPDPSRFVVELVEDLEPGTALDLAAGEGRHALWLAERGWTVTAVDFSEVGIARGQAQPHAEAVRWVVEDVTRYEPDERFDLVVVAYLHLPRAEARRVLAAAASWVRPEGRLVLVGHAVRNLTEGVGGPQDADLLHDEPLYRAAAAGLELERLEEVRRETPDGTAVDVVLRARALP
jgi:SAM-dependent methyltransferase